jgi:hypothetical protein
MGDRNYWPETLQPKVLLHIVGFEETHKEMEERIRLIVKGNIYFGYSVGMSNPPMMNVYFERKEDAVLVKLFVET